MIFKKDPWILVPYRTYCGNQHLYIRGRAFEDQPLKLRRKQSFYKTLRNTYHIFATDELAGVVVQLHLPNKEILTTKTNAEGYFLFDIAINSNLEKHTDLEGYLNFSVWFSEDRIKELRKHSRFLKRSFTGQALIPPVTAQYGIISDIDDTILKTGVTSFLKLSVIWNTFFKNYDSRIPFEGAASFYQMLHQGATQKEQNPIFYLSNSPWNLYRYLQKFLDLHLFPKGPILLRDFNSIFKGKTASLLPHKQHELENILEHYPKINFILIGDGGEYDVDYYIACAKKYPNRVLAIYIRAVNNKKKMKRISTLSNEYHDVPVILVTKSDDAMQHAKSIGLI